MRRLTAILTLALALSPAACARTAWVGSTPTRPAWHPVSSELADALAEGEAPDATTRDWESCQWHDHADGRRHVRCPDGYSQLD
jgi:hypothetical protein